MPQFGRGMSKAASIFGNMPRNQQQPDSRAYQPTGRNNFGSSSFGQMLGNMGMGNHFGQMKQETPQPMMGNMGSSMGRALMPQFMPWMQQQQPMPQQQPMQMPGNMQKPWGDLSGAPGRIGDMYRQGKIQTLGGNFGGFGLM